MKGIVPEAKPHHVVHMEHHREDGPPYLKPQGAWPEVTRRECEPRLAILRH